MRIYFWIMQRKVVTPNDFYDLADVQDRLLAFQEQYNLDALLKRLAAHGSLPAARDTRRIDGEGHEGLNLLLAGRP